MTRNAGRDEKAWCSVQARLYPAESIVRPVPEASDSEYASVLIRRRLAWARRLGAGQRVLDVGCATVEHLLWLAPDVLSAVGVDLTYAYVERARQNALRVKGPQSHFLVGNALALPLADRSMDMAFSFSSLYILPRIDVVLHEIARVLRPGGRFLGDFGNAGSLNAWIAHYQKTAETFYHPLGAIRRMIGEAGFRIIDHAAFQILPYWTRRPRWLWPLLHPWWKTLMERQVGGKMLDEWISSLPGVNRFAFRHLFVCEKMAT